VVADLQILRYKILVSWQEEEDADPASRESLESSLESKRQPFPAISSMIF